MSSQPLNATAASLLGFLSDGPKTGWDLACVVENSIGNFWNVTRSQVYRELKTLADAGLVTEKATGTREKVPYAITAAGRAAFERWIASEPGPEIMRLPIVLTVFFGGHLEPARRRAMVDDARRAHEERLARYQTLHPEVTDPYQRATLDLGIAYERTVIAWLEGLSFKAPRAGSKPRASKKP